MTDAARPDDRPTVTDAELREAITLASLTYLDENDDDPFIQRMIIETFLGYDDLPTAGWQLAWGPASNNTNLWYIARSPGGDRFALVIRGTVMTDWRSKLDDIDIPLVAPLIEGAPDGARIAQGLATCQGRLNGARDVWEHVTAWEYLGGVLDAGHTLDVVGHSLGGALAPIVSLDAMARFPDVAVRSLAIAGMSPGNQAFSHWYVGSLRHQQASRFINRFDIIPEWYAGLSTMQDGFPGGPSCPLKISALIEAMKLYMDVERIQYVATPSPREFPGVIYADRSWTEEAEGQHEHLYYMYLAGVPLEVIHRRFPRYPQWQPPANQPSSDPS